MHVKGTCTLAYYTMCVRNTFGYIKWFIIKVALETCHTTLS